MQDLAVILALMMAGNAADNAISEQSIPTLLSKTDSKTDVHPISRVKSQTSLETVDQELDAQELLSGSNRRRRSIDRALIRRRSSLGLLPHDSSQDFRNLIQKIGSYSSDAILQPTKSEKKDQPSDQDN